MKRILMVAAMFVAALSSCSKNEISEGSLMLASSDAVSFSVYSSGTVASKGTVTSVLSGSQIGIVAYDQGTDNWGTFSDSSNGGTIADLPNFINSYITYGGSAWAFPTGEEHYWESNDSEKYSFFAYGPYDSNSSDVVFTNTSGNTGAPTITYTVNTTQKDMVDFVAGQAMNIYKTGTTTSGSTAGTVNLNLKHQLTRVTFSAISGAAVTDKNTYINVTSLKLISGTTDKLYSKGVYQFGTVTTDADKDAHGQDGTWTFTDQSPLGDFTVDLNDVAFSQSDVTYNTDGVSVGTDAMLDTPTTSANPKVSLFASGDYLFLLPPAASTGLSGDSGATTVQVEVGYDIITVSSGLAGGASTKTGNKVTVDLTTGTLRQGYAYEYVLTISSDENPGSGQSQPDDPSFDKVTVSAAIQNWDVAINTSTTTGNNTQDLDDESKNDETTDSENLEWDLLKN